MQETSASLKRKQENTNPSGLFAFIIYSLESNRYNFINFSIIGTSQHG